MVLGGYPQNSTNAPKACCHSRCASGRAILKRAGLPIVSGRKQAGEGGTATEVCPTVQQILKSIGKWPEVADFCLEEMGGYSSRRHRDVSYVDGPSVQELIDDFERIACVHMSGLLVRSRINARCSVPASGGSDLG